MPQHLTQSRLYFCKLLTYHWFWSVFEASKSLEPILWNKFCPKKLKLTLHSSFNSYAKIILSIEDHSKDFRTDFDSLGPISFFRIGSWRSSREILAFALMSKVRGSEKLSPTKTERLISKQIFEVITNLMWMVLHSRIAGMLNLF